MTSRWSALADLGQSVWYDNVARPALASGHLELLLRDDNITGGTSNPSIFSKAVLESDLYDEDIRSAPAASSDDEIFERCSVQDIQRACDLLRPVWERTEGQDGYISIEEEAALAFGVEPAVRRAHELRGLVDRPNVMVKIPGTEAGVKAFRQLTREGQSINMTLLFSHERYRQIADAYVGALEERVRAGEDVSAIASVASFFVSRVDAQADRQLPDGSPLRGRTPSPTPSSPTPTCSRRSSPRSAGGACAPSAPTCSARCGRPPEPRARRTRRRCTSTSSSGSTR